MFMSTTHRALSAYISRVELPSLLWCSHVLQIPYFLQRYPFYKSDLINTCVSLLQRQVLISYDYSVFVLDIHS